MACALVPSLRDGGLCTGGVENVARVVDETVERCGRGGVGAEHVTVDLTERRGKVRHVTVSTRVRDAPFVLNLSIKPGVRHFLRAPKLISDNRKSRQKVGVRLTLGCDLHTGVTFYTATAQALTFSGW